MFGYITVSRSHLTDEEYEEFCSYYCGVCKAMGKSVSHISRLGLSYDITFLAIVLASVCEEDGVFKCERCIVHPAKKRKCIRDNSAVEYASQMGVLLDYLKLADDWHDDKSIKALLGMGLFAHGYSRVKRKYPSQIEFIKNKLAKLSVLEQEKCPDIDKTADCFAAILEYLFAPDFINDNKTKRALRWLGYNLGRWIYIIDAYNDIESDYHCGAYNPFLVGMNKSVEDYKKENASMIELSLMFTLENIASAYELIDFKKNKDIIGKIIYLSLKHKQNAVLSGEVHKVKHKCFNRRNKTNESI